MYHRSLGSIIFKGVIAVQQLLALLSGSHTTNAILLREGYRTTFREQAGKHKSQK